MNRCTGTDKPLISILMAVYEPRMDWLKEQLLSLNAQTYPNLKLYVRDDCSTAVPYEEIKACVRECIHAFPYEIQRNEENLGSNKTFERLTQEAEGEYFACCDQDDVWQPEKLLKLEELLSTSDGNLICSDVMVIDGTGDVSARSITELRPRHVFLQGRDLAATLIYRNFVIGCTMLIRERCAKAALPFAEHMVHDHYLAFCCSMEGAILVCPECLVKYRIHGNNQTGVLARVIDRESYVAYHILPFAKRIEELQQRFELGELERSALWAQARIENARREPNSRVKLWKLRNINRTTTLFELVALRFPKPLFQIVVRIIRSGKI